MATAKFLNGQRVKFLDRYIIRRDHFVAGGEAIIISNYHSRYIGRGYLYKYHLLLLIPNDSYDSRWHDEETIEMVCSNEKKGKKIVEEWKKKNKSSYTV